MSFEFVLERDIDDSPDGRYHGAPTIGRTTPDAPPVIVTTTAMKTAPQGIDGVDATGALLFRFDDLESDTDHVAIWRDSSALNDASGRLAVGFSGNGTTCVDVASGGRTDYPSLASTGFPNLYDIDHDGIAEIVTGDEILTAACTSVMRSPPAVLTGDPAVFATTDAGSEVYATGTGLWDLSSGASAAWSWPYDFMELTFFPVADPDGDLRVIQSNRSVVVVADAMATPQVWFPLTPVMGLDFALTFAFGDLDGDGTGELVTREFDRLVARDLNLNKLWELGGEVGPYDYIGQGGIALADLDADGNYEIIDWSLAGLLVVDGDGTVLAEDRTVATRLLWTQPVVADVDLDGSAEIVVGGQPKADTESDPSWMHTYIFGPASGRWARTRPVWNQTGYDVTTVHDDGSIVRFPRPNWKTYNTYRAQPAHDGDHPDLTARATDACASACAVGGTVEVNVVVENLGSAEAPPGARIVLSTWDGSGLTPVAEATVPTAIPSMGAAEGVLLRVPYEEWGIARIVDVQGASDDECDLVNDRIDVWVDPCGE